MIMTITRLIKIHHDEIIVCVFFVINNKNNNCPIPIPHSVLHQAAS